MDNAKGRKKREVRVKWSRACILAAVAVVACSDATGVPVQDLDIVATADGLKLTNNTDGVLFYQAVDATTLAMWAGPAAVTLCETPACPEVSPHDSVLVTWDDVLGWAETTKQISVYWWQVVSDGEGHWRVSDDTVQSRNVDIP